MLWLLLACTVPAPTVVAVDDTVEPTTADTTADTPAADTPDTPVSVDTPADSAPDCPLDTCAGSCTDVRIDPFNCGQCGITCIIPAADAACVDGACVVGACDNGWADCDRAVRNGCEAPIVAVGGAACATTCGSTGAIHAADVCNPVCTPPAEACNAHDDDCDGQCDEGAIAGCRVAVHRAYNAVGGHLFTNDLGEAQRWGLEAAGFFWLHSAADADLRPFFRCSVGGAPFYTASQDCEGTGAPLSILGFIAPPGSTTCGATPLHRLVSPVDGHHFYTVSAPERDAAVSTGWISEGEAGGVWLGP